MSARGARGLRFQGLGLPSTLKPKLRLLGCGDPRPTMLNPNNAT